MNNGLRISSVFACLLAMALEPASAQDESNWAESIAFPAVESRVKLFNGRDLSGWEGQTARHWRVQDGEIRGANDTNIAASTYLFTTKSYRNFRLLFEVRQSRGPRYSTMHSAVAVLGEKFTDHADPFSFRGPLLMFCNDWGMWDANRRNRVFPPKQNGQWPNPREKVGDWNRIEVLVIGDRIRMAVNGGVFMDFSDEPGLLRASPIGLQLHSNSRPQEYRFRGLILSEQPENRMLTAGTPAR
jgi:hypothetical protein